MFYAVLAVLILIGIYILLIRPGNGYVPESLPVAHRGLHDIENGIPENSKKAFKKAVENGYAIEVDVHTTSDGKVVIFHDENMKRICGYDKSIMEATYDEIKDMTLFDTEERIPLLKEVLELVDGKVPLLVEIKHERDAKRICEATDKLLREYHGQYMMQSFDPRMLSWYRKNRREVPRGILVEAYNKNGTRVNWLAEILLRSLVMNVSARPDFLSYNYKDAKRSVVLFLCRKIYKARTAYWVIREDKDFRSLMRRKSIVIFESFRPSKHLQEEQ